MLGNLHTMIIRFLDEDREEYLSGESLDTPSIKKILHS